MPLVECIDLASYPTMEMALAALRDGTHKRSCCATSIVPPKRRSKITSNRAVPVVIDLTAPVVIDLTVDDVAKPPKIIDLTSPPTNNEDNSTNGDPKSSNEPGPSNNAEDNDGVNDGKVPSNE
jgi:hypothetical protein